MSEKRLGDVMFASIELAAKLYERIHGWQARLLIREIWRLREALAFYAKVEKYFVVIGAKMEVVDAGKTARVALGMEER